MKKHLAALFLILSSVTFLASGCAKKEVVKMNDPLAPGATASGSSAVKAEPLKVEAVQPEAGVTPAAGAQNSAQSQNGAADKGVEPISGAAKLAAELERIHFDFDRYTLSPEARDILTENAEQLKKDPTVKVRIAGHCDERGSGEYNLALSHMRAKSAMQYLVSLGIPEERLAVMGYGEEKPLAAGHDEASWSQNRRDDFEIVSR